MAILEVTNKDEKGMGKGRSSRERGSAQLIWLEEQGGRDITAVSLCKRSLPLREGGFSPNGKVRRDLGE